MKKKESKLDINEIQNKFNNLINSLITKEDLTKYKNSLNKADFDSNFILSVMGNDGVEYNLDLAVKMDDIVSEEDYDKLASIVIPSFHYKVDEITKK